MPATLNVMHTPDLPQGQPDPDLQHTAHAWVVRLTSGAAVPEDVAAAKAWCDEAPAHRQAFVEARRLWQLSGHLAVAPVRRTYKQYWPLASAAVLVLAVAVLLVRQNAWDADYVTARGEQQRIELADGSRILLDSGSALDVQLTANGRRIELRKGEALFEVAHDPQRPFTVQSGDLSATALGTVYSVRREAHGSAVIVAQGRVAVRDPSGDAVLEAGEGVSQERGVISAKYPLNTDKALAWQHGRLVFEMAPLAEVLAAVERYRPGLILIGDESLRSLKVSGTFQLDRLDEGLVTLEQVFPLRIQRYSPYLLIFEPRT